MFTPSEIARQLSRRNLRRVARETGLHYNTVRKYRHGLARQPDYRVVQTLSDYLYVTYRCDEEDRCPM